MTELIKFNNTKDIEILSMVGQKQSFPDHFHKTFCISLITEGVECMKIDDKLIYSTTDFISITNPYEIHSNPLKYNSRELSFHTIYIPQNSIDEIAGKDNVFFEKRTFKDVRLNKLFLNIVNYSKENSNELSFPLFKKFIDRLIVHSSGNLSEEDFTFKHNWKRILIFIDKNLQNDIDLEILATHCEMDKFKFAKSFKHFCGMSPMNYVLMKRVFEAKQDITIESNLTYLAYTYNFTDMAHFSRHFKRFVGLSPKNYQKSLSK